MTVLAGLGFLDMLAAVLDTLTAFISSRATNSQPVRVTSKGAREPAQSFPRPHSDFAPSIISFTAGHSLRSLNVSSANFLPAKLSDG